MPPTSRSPGAYPGINQRRPAADDDGMNGCGFYELLGLTHKASAQEIRASYRKLAKVCHPDKSSGDPEVFSRLQHAFEVLIDPAQRKVYDHQVLWSDKAPFYQQSASYKSSGWESEGNEENTDTNEAYQASALLNELACRGVKCDPRTQLGKWMLHWPLVNSPHMLEKLARQEMEKKRAEDAQRFGMVPEQYSSTCCMILLTGFADGRELYIDLDEQHMLIMAVDSHNRAGFADGRELHVDLDGQHLLIMAVDSHSRAGASSPNEMANCNNIDATGLDESSANNKCTTACDDFSNITGNTGSDKRGSIGVTDIDESIANNNGATGVLAGPIPHQVQSMEVSVDAGQPAQRKS
eukprot:gene27688-7329_t